MPSYIIGPGVGIVGTAASAATMFADFWSHEVGQQTSRANLSVDREVDKQREYQ